MRAKPPPADDFIDIFEKFKFAFNLLAKLKAHIHDPNAPELVHFLFTPLSLIYEASRDPVHGGRDLAESATRPSITQDAKQLLLNCLTSKELELWQSLGKSWTNSRYFLLRYLIHVPFCYELLRVKILKVKLFVYQITCFLCLKYKNNIEIFIGICIWLVK